MANRHQRVGLWPPIVAMTLIAIVGSRAAPASCAQSLWVANESDNNIVQIRPGVGAVANPLGIAFDKANNAWITTGGDFVEEFSAGQLKHLGTTPSPSPKATIAITPMESMVGLAFDKGGNLWAADEHGGGAIHKLSKRQLAAGGADVTPAVSITSTSIGCPQFVSFDKAGNLWVSDECKNTIFEFKRNHLTASGNKTPDVAISGHMSDPGQMAFDTQGNLWVTSANDSKVVEFAKSTLSSSGSPTPGIILSSDGASPASLDDPFGLAFDASGDLWICNYNGNTVAEFSPAQIAASGNPAPIALIPGIFNEAYQITFGPAL